MDVDRTGSVGGDGEAHGRLGEGDVQERADRLRRRQGQRLGHQSAPRTASVRAAQDHVEAEPERPLGDRRVVVVGRDEGVAGPFGHGVVDRILEEQRVVGEVHLGDQPLGEGATEQAEVQVGRAPGVGVVAPWVGTGADRREAIAPSASVRQRPSPVKLGSSVPGQLSLDVAVAARGVGLPQLDERAGDRSAAGVEQPSGDDDPLADGFAVGTDGQVGVGVDDGALAEDRSAELAAVELGRVEDERVTLRVAQMGRAVLGGVERRMRPRRCRRERLDGVCRCSCVTPCETLP